MKVLRKSRRSIITYLEELRRHDVCTIRSAVNQHTGGEIEICDAFWPYERVPSGKGTSDEASYAEQVRRLFQARRCIKSSFSPADQKLAISFFRQGVGIEQVETALLLGCARKYIAMLNGTTSGPITSLGYFQDVVDEVGRLKISGDYAKYLRLRVDRFEQELPSADATPSSHQF